jgi:Peptidase S24-like
MDEDSVRSYLDGLIQARGGNYGALSRLIGRNAAYIQQYIKRGTPRKLDEADRRTLARYFGVDESVLGGLPAPMAQRVKERGPTLGYPRSREMTIIERLALGVSAGAGTVDPDERASGVVAFDPRWLQASGLHEDTLSILHVDGESMAPTLNNGDDIMVDRADAASRLRDGIYVLRFDDALMVKRVARTPRPRGEGEEHLTRWILTISSDNPHYPTWHDVDTSLVEIVGRVVWAGRRML